MLAREQAEETKRQLEHQYGRWTATNVQVAPGVWTIGPEYSSGNEYRLRRVVQVATDMSGRPLPQVRILDLASQEGMFSIEFARHGATVVGLEVREAHLAKAEFAKQALGLDNLTFMQGDVRAISRDRYGSFDVVLCLGILYHLDAPDAFEVVNRLGEVCDRCLIVDTHVSLRDKVEVKYRGQSYHGMWYREHDPEDTTESRQNRLWASIDNDRSFWPTRPSLYNLLCRAGFTSVYECHHPPIPGYPADRVTLVALRGQPEDILSWPDAKRADHTPERQTFSISPQQRPVLGRSGINAWIGYVARRGIRAVPARYRTGLRRLVRSARRP